MALTYIVRVAGQEPFGYWEYRVDAQDGRIVEKFDRRIQENKRASALDPESQMSLSPVSLQSFLGQEAISAKAARKTAGFPATTKGLVFDPNPVTSLNDTSLKDSSADANFVSAYTRVDLFDITKSGNVLSLTGPDVRIEDFEPGEGGRNMPPSTSTSEWTAHRGANEFNDVMSYYFLTASIKYLRSLGYTGTAELFPNGIAVDSDGVDGDDNSHYVPGSDVLAFGHACVDDNEDTDVILHEFGHALHTHINPSWSGGDSGAIGEGFGDYWAVSYRTKIMNGTSPDPGKVFPWDGISDCWPGRRVDVDKATYDPSRRYGAHQSINDFQSDELWSTPLVRALRV